MQNYLSKVSFEKIKFQILKSKLLLFKGGGEYFGTREAIVSYLKPSIQIIIKRPLQYSKGHFVDLDISWQDHHSNEITFSDQIYIVPRLAIKSFC